MDRPRVIQQSPDTTYDKPPVVRRSRQEASSQHCTALDYGTVLSIRQSRSQLGPVSSLWQCYFAQVALIMGISQQLRRKGWFDQFLGCNVPKGNALAGSREVSNHNNLCTHRKNDLNQKLCHTCHKQEQIAASCEPFAGQELGMNRRLVVPETRLLVFGVLISIHSITGNLTRFAATVPQF